MLTKHKSHNFMYFPCLRHGTQNNPKNIYGCTGKCACKGELAASLPTGLGTGPCLAEA